MVSSVGWSDFLRPPPEMNFSDLDQIDLAERWRRWRETMELYLRLNMADSDKKEQCDAFRYIIGQDGRDIYNTMTFTSSEVNKIDALFAKFEDYCKPRKNVIMERYKFNTRTQQKDETADQYVTELKLIAKNCNFGSLEDELIRDRLVYGSNSERVKERLLREEELTLLKALKICRADEQSNKQLKAMKTEEDVHAICKPKESKVNKNQFKLNAKRKNLRSVTINNTKIYSNASIVANQMHRSNVQHLGRNVITVERIIISLKSVKRRKYLVLKKIKQMNT